MEKRSISEPFGKSLFGQETRPELVWGSAITATAEGAAQKFFDAPVTDAAAVAALNVINDACLNGTRRDAK